MTRSGLSQSPWYIATQAFKPGSRQDWRGYVAWSQLAQLIEVVSLDIVLCPAVLDPLTPEDWEHNVQDDYLISFFVDLDYLLRRVARLPDINVLAVLREPSTADCAAFNDPRFAFMGFDLVEKPGLGISALSNCGGFPLAFANSDLNHFGLLPDYAAASAAQRKLLEHYPDEHHADCYVWAIWRMRDRP